MGFGKDNKGVMIRESNSQALGALAANAAIFVSGPTLTEDFRMLKSEISAVVDSLTAGEGGNLRLYLVQAGLTLAEAEAAIETTGPLRRGDRADDEIAERFVKVIGQTPEPPDAAGTDLAFRDPHTDALLIVAKPRWTFPNLVGESSWNYMVFNAGGTLTTGSSVRMKNTHYGIWIE